MPMVASLAIALAYGTIMVKFYHLEHQIPVGVEEVARPCDIGKPPANITISLMVCADIKGKFQWRPAKLLNTGQVIGRDSARMADI